MRTYSCLPLLSCQEENDPTSWGEGFTCDAASGDVAVQGGMSLH